jgi:anti-sigma B factor antagonist
MDHDTSPPLRVRNVGGITIAEFTAPKIDTEARETLYALVENQPKPRLVVNFANVRFLSSAPIGMLVSLNNKANAAGGVLRFCHLDTDVREILRLTKVVGLFSIFDTEQDAIESFRGT